MNTYLRIANSLKGDLGLYNIYKQIGTFHKKEGALYTENIPLW